VSVLVKRENYTGAAVPACVTLHFCLCYWYADRSLQVSEVPN